MKRSYLVAAVLLLTTLFAPACGSRSPDCTRPDVFCVGLVTDVGRVDNLSFNQSAWEGVQQSMADGAADWVQYIETIDAKDYDKNIAIFGDAGYDVIVTVGFNLTGATRAAAATYPDTYFIGVDQYQTATIANVSGLNFPEDQAGFLAGALAAMMSQTRKIGAVCGTDESPSIWRYCEGYRSGAWIIDPSVQVFVEYHNDVGFDKTFVDPGWGAAMADAMVDNGADVIFGAGGATGDGAVKEAALRGVYAIGADSDQYYSLPEAAPRLLSSAIKLISPGVTELIAAASTAQNGGAAFPAGNFMGGAGYAPYHDLDVQVSREIKARLEEINRGLLDGTIWTNVSPVKISNP
jgi:basic membrane protein A